MSWLKLLCYKIHFVVVHVWIKILVVIFLMSWCIELVLICRWDIFREVLQAQVYILFNVTLYYVRLCTAPITAFNMIVKKHLVIFVYYPYLIWYYSYLIWVGDRLLIIGIAQIHVYFCWNKPHIMVMVYSTMNWTSNFCIYVLIRISVSTCIACI